MISIFKTIDNAIHQIEEPEKDCWISLIHPDEAELKSVADRYAIDIDDLRAALDEEERSRIEVEPGYTLILVDIPKVEKREDKDKERYVTQPLGIFLTKEAILTVCLEETPILSAIGNKRTREFHTHMKTRFVLQILYRNASLYLQYLRAIDRASEMVERKLHGSTKNRELIELLEMEKSLVYFTTSLRGNEVVFEKLLKNENIKKYPEDTDLLEDVIVENRQAIEMANIYSGILSGMMDAFASVISNNLNIVMKSLTVVTLVLSVPTMIFSAFGMNIPFDSIPFVNTPYGFFLVILLAVLMSVAVAVFFSKRNM